ncbi:hypothetical protein DXT63_17085 [Thermoanaerobacteraceae bacterium SP2]|nr:hypothetical protein DXT63_17085 [Thermoanaerobacteraceae bacterium SP2]
MNWENIKSDIFTLTGIENDKNADKLFVSLLQEIERRGIDINKTFTIAEIAELIPRETAGVNNYATYGFSIMSMFSGQKHRDYFIFETKGLRDEFTSICNNNHDRDNYIWKKLYKNKRVRINPKYIKAS